MDLTKLIDLPSEPIMGHAAKQEAPAADGSSRKSMRLNPGLSIQQPAGLVISSSQKSPRAPLPSAFTVSGSTPPLNSSPMTTTPIPSSPSSYSSPPEPVVVPHSQATKLFLANVLVVVEKMEEEQQFSTERQTALNFTFQTVVSYIRQLVTAVNNKFNDQFVDITATVVHEGGEIMRSPTCS